MISKKELIDLFIESMSGGVAPDYSKWHPQVVSRYIDIALNSIIAKEVAEAEVLGYNLVDNGWVKTYERERIRWDKNSNRCYIEIPAKVIYMRNNKGIREIGWPSSTDESSKFVIQDTSSYPVIGNLECSILETGVYFAIVEGERIFFQNMPKMYATKRRKLRCLLVVSSSGYEEEEVLPLAEERVAEIFQLAQTLMGSQYQTRAKVLNDNNPNTV